MPTLPELFPNADDVIDLEPEELAWRILQILAVDPDRKHRLSGLHQIMLHYGAGRRYPLDERLSRAIGEGWGWLVNEGILVPDPSETPHGQYFVTRRGQQLRTRADFASYRKASVFPKELLHTRIQSKAWPLFRRGDHDVAVLQAFKEVEIAVRTAGAYPDGLVGKDLMEEAFKPHVGPLTDKNRIEAEQIPERRLFSGAIGSYKNPQSHREIVLSAEEAAEMIIFASHLLRIVEARRPA
jgi:uncharacterized protein (TIGR02391 family)